MLFNSFEFGVFLVVVFFLYWFVTNRNLKMQNLLIFVSSYVFYGWWDWRFLSLIAFSTIIDYSVGLGLAKNEGKKQRALLLWTSIIVNLGFLMFFKYYNFFVDSFVGAFTFFGFSFNARSLSIILPVGISFYTFQTLSYTIDVYNRKLKPTKDFIAFGAFVSFFPQLVAGPIERATHLLPQFYTPRKFDYDNASAGLKMMLWGMFMKVGVADRVSLYVDNVYGNVSMHSSVSLIVATIFFAVQIYCDFGGYSLIAIGCAKLFGFSLMKNFNRPYLAGSFKEFWQRWHISLSSWFRDYLYIPLGGSRNGSFKTQRNLFVTFVVSGFWHGANWTFIVWGALHGAYLVIEKSLSMIKLPKPLRIVIVFILACFSWIFFRAASVGAAFDIITKIVRFESTKLYTGDIGIFSFSIVAILVLFLNDFLSEFKPSLKLFHNDNLAIRYVSIVFILLYIVSLGVFDQSQFIYFQF